MADEEKELDQNMSDEESGSVEDQQNAGPEEVDYKGMYEKSEAERRELASLMGRQGQELGELRRMIQGSQQPEDEVNPYEFFDEDTAKSIDKIVEKRVEEKLKSLNEKVETQRLESEFKSVYAEYDVTEDSLTDLAYYASAKGVSLVKAAEQLSQKGIIDKRSVVKRTVDSANVDLNKAPAGMPKNVNSGRPGAGRSPLKMSQEEWDSMDDKQREAALRKATLS